MKNFYVSVLHPMIICPRCSEKQEQLGNISQYVSEEEYCEKRKKDYPLKEPVCDFCGEKESGK